MRMRLAFSALSIFGSVCWMIIPAVAQVDTVRMLREVEVTATRIDFTDIGKHSDDFDTAGIARLPHAHLASLLQGQTPLYIRSYGNGTLSTIGIRGGSASHTQLMWNGIPIRNPMVGLVDVALIPTGIIDDASVHYGGHGSAFGSGAVGGLISFANDPLQGDEHINLHVYGGSWHENGASLKMTYGNEHLAFGTRLIGHFAKNDFTYRLADTLPDRKQTNHALNDQALLQEMRWNVNARNAIVGRVWWQFTDRQIPPTSVQTTSKSSQQDKSLRTSLQWKHAGDVWNWQFKTAMLDESIDFQDSLILLYTHNRFRTWIGEFEMSGKLFPLVDIAAGLYAEHVEASSDSEVTIDNYDGINVRNQQALYASLRYGNDDKLVRLQLREELTDDNWSPLLLDVAAEWQVIKHLTWKGSVSRNYRVPTLNDLYWRPGGNPDLQPEEGWTMESGLHVATTSNAIAVNASVTGYLRYMHQWIMWMPPVKDIRTFWAPINVNTVKSRGIESRLNTVFTHHKLTATLFSGMDFTWSTFEEALPEFRIEAGDQLFYVPVENILAGVQLSVSGWQARYQHHWFGKSTGINDDVRAGDVGAFTFSREWSGEAAQFEVYLHIDNTWDVPYRLIERRPMPGRSAKAGVQVTF